MAIKHTISEEVYTNSILIYPHFDQDNIAEYFWRRKNPHFSSSYEQKITQYTPDLAYQCTVLDYRSTIELMILDKGNRKTVYSYGPVGLQPDLLHFRKNQILKYSIQAYFNKKDRLQAYLKIHKHETQIQILVEGENGIKIALTYQLGTMVSKIVCVEGVQTNELLLNFGQNKKVILEMLKILKIYTVSGNYLKFVFENQVKRDIFLLHLLSTFGYEFEGLEASKKVNPFEIKPHELKDLKERKSTNPIPENQINGLFSSQKEPISPITPQIGQQIINDIYDILYTPKMLTPIDKLKNNEEEKSQIEKQRLQRVTQSLFFDKQKQNRQFSPAGKEKSPAQKMKKSSIDKNRQDKNRRKTRNKFSFMGDDFCLEEQYVILFQKTKRIEDENQNLKKENKQLKNKLKEFTKAKSKNKEVPEFIKILQINKALKKKNPEFIDKPEGFKKVKQQTQKTQTSQTNERFQKKRIPSCSHQELKKTFAENKTEEEEVVRRYSKGKNENIKSMTFFPYTHHINKKE